VIFGGEQERSPQREHTDHIVALYATQRARDARVQPAIDTIRVKRVSARELFQKAQVIPARSVVGEANRALKGIKSVRGHHVNFASAFEWVIVDYLVQRHNHKTKQNFN